MFKFIEFTLVTPQNGHDDVMINVQHITHVTDGQEDTAAIHLSNSETVFVKQEYCGVMDRILTAAEDNKSVYLSEPGSM